MKSFFLFAAEMPVPFGSSYGLQSRHEWKKKMYLLTVKIVLREYLCVHSHMFPDVCEHTHLTLPPPPEGARQDNEPLMSTALWRLRPFAPWGTRTSWRIAHPKR